MLVGFVDGVGEQGRLRNRRGVEDPFQHGVEQLLAEVGKLHLALSGSVDGRGYPVVGMGGSGGVVGL